MHERRWPRRGRGPERGRVVPMQYALRADEMRGAERAAVEAGTTTIDELMRRAGNALANEVQRLVPHGAVTVVCGPGNNGGDGWTAAHVLRAARRDVRVIALVSPERLDGAARSAADAAVTAGVPWRVPANALEVAGDLDGAAVIIDAVFGFGSRGAPREPYASAILAIEDSDTFVVSADVPSGVDADTGAVAGAAVRADLTVTFSAVKPGLLIQPGAGRAGEIVVTDLGIARSTLESHGHIELWDRGDLRAAFPVPAPQDHKASRGRVAVVAGSTTYTGAAVLTVQGALRMGAGYVIAVVPEPVASVVRIAHPSALVRALPASRDGACASATDVLKAVEDADAIVVGPGLTTSAGAMEAVRALVSHTAMPLVLDADALAAFTTDPEALAAREAPLLLTPHPGEMARLLGSDTATIQADRVAAADGMSGPWMACLLKGPHSIVAGSGREAIVLAGNEGLARAGSGDVLSGMLGTLLAQGLMPFEAGVLGAYLHGRAADHGVAALTTTCFTSADIVSFLPDAVRDVLGG